MTAEQLLMLTPALVFAGLGLFGFCKWFVWRSRRGRIASIIVVLFYFGGTLNWRQRQLCPWTPGNAGPVRACDDFQAESIATAVALTLVVMCVWGVGFLAVGLIRRWLRPKYVMLRQQTQLCDGIVELVCELRPEVDAALKRRPDDARLHHYRMLMETGPALAAEWAQKSASGVVAPRADTAALRQMVSELVDIKNLVLKAKS